MGPQRERGERGDASTELQATHTSMALLARFDAQDDSGGGGALAGAALAARSVEGALCVRCPARAPAVARVRMQPVCASCIVTGVQRRVMQFYHDSPAHGRGVMVSLNGDGAQVLCAMTRRVMDTGRKRRVLADASAVFVDATALTELLAATERAPTRFAAGGGTPSDPSPLGAHSLLHCTLTEAARDGLHTVVVPLEAALLVSAAAGDERSGSGAAAGDLAAGRAPLHSVVLRAPDVPDSGLSKPREPLDSGSRPADDPAVVAAVDAALAELDALRGDPAIAAARTRLVALFASAATVDGRQALLSALAHRAAVTAALDAGVAFLATPETADSLAVGFLTGVCQGKGFGLPVDTLPVDYRYARGAPWAGGAEGGGGAPLRPLPPSPWYPTLGQPPLAAAPAGGVGVVLLRPLMDVEDAEVRLASGLLGLAAPRHPSFAGCAPPRTSVQAVIAGVLAGLQRGYASTVHNVVRTARKLALPPGAPRSFEEEATAAAAHEAAREMREALHEVDGEDDDESDEGGEEEGEGEGAEGDEDNTQGGERVVSAGDDAGADVGDAAWRPDGPPPLCPLCGALVRAQPLDDAPAMGRLAEAPPAWLAQLLPPGPPGAAALCNGCAQIR